MQNSQLKKIFLSCFTILFSLTFSSISFCQSGQWVWEKGDSLINRRAHYGQKGVSSSDNFPGSRVRHAAWTAPDGSGWIFGGEDQKNVYFGYLNDLWYFNSSTHQWTWVSGDTIPNQPGAYGSKGNSGPNNKPGSRTDMVTWVTPDSNLWLFGGYGSVTGVASGFYNDLWKFSLKTREWTWVSGTNLFNKKGVKGAVGIPDSISMPGARYQAGGVVDKEGNLWLFGGNGYEFKDYPSYLKDLWKFDTKLNLWSWESGIIEGDHSGIYGNKGIEDISNLPGARTGQCSWTDNVGNLWMFGGEVSSNPSQGIINDLWVYKNTTKNWTWISGDSMIQSSGNYTVKGVESPLVVPCARTLSSFWKDSNGNFWLYGGYGIRNGSLGYLNDVWKFNPNTKKWTWISGSDKINENAVFGVLGISDTTNIPGSRKGATVWVDQNNKVWMFGGYGYKTSGLVDYLNDLWKFDPVTKRWTWLNGKNFNNNTGIYGIKGVECALCRPGVRQDAMTWIDVSGNLWVFGGFGYDYAYEGYLSDLWRYNFTTKKWTWISGKNIINRGGRYGNRNLPSDSVYPGARKDGLTWTDSLGNFWLFGGYGYDSIRVGHLNDLWKYNPQSRQWTWIKGSREINSMGVYSGFNIIDTLSSPSARNQSSVIKDTKGKVWLFGGYGYSQSNQSGYLHDLWKFDPVNQIWVWINGSRQVNPSSIYGIKKTPSALNQPGGVRDAVLWQDDANNCLWLFGGYGYTDSSRLGYLNLLWKYHLFLDQWSYEKGYKKINQYGVYNASEVDADSLKPGCRTQSSGFKDSNGNLMIFGGYGYSRYGSGYLNDVWRYTPTTGFWEWVTGSDVANQLNQYGKIDSISITNQPSGRIMMSSWINANGDFMLYGGYGYETKHLGGYYRDMWKLNKTTFYWSWINPEGINTNFHLGKYGVFQQSDTSAYPGSRQNSCSWLDKNTGNLWLFGGQGFSSDNIGHLNDLWSMNLDSMVWRWQGGSSQCFASSVFGSLGAPSTSTQPGARSQASFWQTDSSFWLMGGNTNGVYLNDLWKYSIYKKQWTWVSGAKQYNQMGNYGIMGQATYSNVPGSRSPSGFWKISDTLFYIFGGHGLETTTIPGFMNDLWRYDVNKKQWTWSSGLNLNNLFGIYGELKTSSKKYSPGARSDFTIWSDNNEGIWLLGGYGNSEIDVGYLNDLWRYDIPKKEWSWIMGDKKANELGNYGPKGVFSPTLYPGARRGSFSIYDKGNNIWLLGGYGYAKYSSGYLNDIWKFDLEKQQWAYMNGSQFGNPSGVYNKILGINSSTYLSGRKDFNGWLDTTGNILIHGGEGIGYDTTQILGVGKLNDVFRFDFGKYPEPDFIADTLEGCIPLQVSFTNTSKAADTYYWDFGDGNNSTNANPVHVYSEGGEYTVVLGATNKAGSIYKVRKKYILAHPRPNIQFTVNPSSPIIGIPSVFTNSTTNGVSYSWNFGDGDTSTSIHPVHTYSTLGKKTIILSVISENGCLINEIFTDFLEVIPVPPIDPLAIFYADETIGCSPLKVKFYNYSLNSTKYKWDFGDGNTSTIKEPEHTFYSPGSYTIKLIADDDTIQSTEIKVAYIKVSDDPVPDISVVNNKPVLGDSAFFINKSLGAISYVWDFGDGYTSPGKNPSHKYRDLGLYDITLTAINSLGCKTTKIFPFYIEILPPKPVVKFFTPMFVGCNPLEVSFNNYCDYAGTYFWDFGDGGSSTEFEPVHIYQTPNKYTVSLTAFGQSGQNTLIKSDYINVLVSPILAIGADKTQTTVNNPVHFKNLSVGDINGYLWNFGDSSLSTKNDPVHSYQFPGIYTITLDATSGSGCSISKVFPNFIEVSPSSVIEKKPFKESIVVYPNPFNESLFINFHLFENQKILVELFDITGSKIIEKADNYIPAGSHLVEFSDKKKINAGMYLMKIHLKNKIKYIKVVKE